MLIEPLSEEQLNTVFTEILSPLAWDLGHIANFEELWLVQRVGGREPLDGALGSFYDAIENPRRIRNELPLLRGEQLRRYMDEVRERTLDVLAGADLEDESEPLLAGGFIYEMLIAHEHQHNETMLQLLQFVDGYPRPGLDRPGSAPASGEGPEMVPVEGGAYEVGAPPSGFSYDNERPRHEVELDPFLIDRTAVTNGAFAAYIEDAGAEPPMFWEHDGEGGWLDARFGLREPVDATLPVVGVSWSQAADFAAWAGKRLPTEFEWEAASEGADRARANLDQLAYGPLAAGASADSASLCGAEQMLGDVWEWTSSGFEAYPAFRAFPYAEYSEVFFGGDYRVLRGGSWATRRDVVRRSFRNWDHPYRAQIFSGLRCAADASHRSAPPAREKIRIEVRLVDGAGTSENLARDARAGLAAEFKQLPPKYFYDEEGSQLFEQITGLAEYYPTRTERSILAQQSAAIVAAADPQCLVELGSGSASKTRTLLDAMQQAGSLHTYVPVDISEEITRATAAELVEEYPELRVHGVICDFENHLERLPGWGQRRMFAFLGGTIGNFDSEQRIAFLSRIGSLLGSADTLLLGTDLVKDTARLEAAYNDASGVTARFNKNVLSVLNRELGADFDLEGFEHRAFYDAERERIDIRLRSLADQSVRVRDLGIEVPFRAGEEMRTELSCKFTRDSLERSYAAAGLEMVEFWTDPEQLFALSLARPA